MRDIKYRGKGLNDGEWAYGDIVTVTNTKMEAIQIFIHNRLSPVQITEDRLIHGVVLVRVDPKTVGQFTGLYDKNKKEAYEHDIYEKDDILYQIVWMNDYAKWGMKVIKTNYVLSNGLTFPMQQYIKNGILQANKLGNKYDNPNLLKEE